MSKPNLKPLPTQALARLWPGIEEDILRIKAREPRPPLRITLTVGRPNDPR